jgi:hypothetical protein
MKSGLGLDLWKSYFKSCRIIGAVGFAESEIALLFFGHPDQARGARVPLIFRDSLYPVSPEVIGGWKHLEVGVRCSSGNGIVCLV